jgi:hypothetical protein
MAELDRVKAHAAVEQLVTKSFRRGIPCGLLSSACELVRKYFDVCVHAAKIEVEDLESAVCLHVNDKQLLSTQEDHYATMLEATTSRHHMIGLLFFGTTKIDWAPIGTYMGACFPGRLTIFLATYRFGRIFDAPLRRLIESRPLECESVVVVP